MCRLETTVQSRAEQWEASKQKTTGLDWRRPQRRGGRGPGITAEGEVTQREGQAGKDGDEEGQAPIAEAWGWGGRWPSPRLGSRRVSASAGSVLDRICPESRTREPPRVCRATVSEFQGS